MDYKIDGSRGSNRRNLREIHQNNINGQASVERQFQKPGGYNSPANIDMLYFKGGIPQQSGARINPSKNFSSNARVFGLEGNLDQKGGKRQYNGGRAYSHSNLISGSYGVDPLASDLSGVKPYSKQS